jgi:AcrR family transcriptional regulator
MTSPSKAETSGLRELQQAFSRRLITEALARVVVETGIHKFSMQEVADEAGVSLRTLYRYYSGREELLEGLELEVGRIVSEGGLDVDLDPVSPEGVAELVGQLFGVLGERSDLARAWVIANLTTGFESEARERHDRTIRRLVEELGPHLDPRERHRLFAVLRCLAGSLSWKVMTDDLELEEAEAAEAAGWAVRTLLRDIQGGGRPVLTERS